MLSDKLVLDEHQYEGEAHLRSRRYSYLADDMGLGKTIEAIYANEKQFLGSTLIVCPTNVAFKWVKEINKFVVADNLVQYLSSVDTEIIPGMRYYIVTYKMTILKDLSSLKIKRMICDEAHRLSNRFAQQTKRTIGFKKGLVTKVDSVWLMSGTYMSNYADGLFTACKLCLGKELAPYDTYEKFRRKFCVGYSNGLGQYFITGNKNEALLKTYLDKFMLIRSKKAAGIKLPDKKFRFLQVTDSTIKKVVDEEWSKLSDEGIDRFNLPSIKKIKELGSVVTTRKATAIAKYGAMKEYINTFLEESDGKLVVMGCHRDVVDRLHIHYKDISVKVNGATTKKQDAVSEKMFEQDDNIRLFIGNHDACGEGIDLISASNMVFVEPCWTPRIIKQVSDRIHRRGQTKDCTIDFLLAKESIEVYMMKRAISKLRSQEKTEQHEPKRRITCHDQQK